jgi:hypothetical protein
VLAEREREKERQAAQAKKAGDIDVHLYILTVTRQPRRPYSTGIDSITRALLRWSGAEEGSYRPTHGLVQSTANRWQVDSTGNMRLTVLLTLRSLSLSRFRARVGQQAHCVFAGTSFLRRQSTLTSRGISAASSSVLPLRRALTPLAVPISELINRPRIDRRAVAVWATAIRSSKTLASMRSGAACVRR